MGTTTPNDTEQYKPFLPHESEHAVDPVVDAFFTDLFGVDYQTDRMRQDSFDIMAQAMACGRRSERWEVLPLIETVQGAYPEYHPSPVGALLTSRHATDSAGIYIWGLARNILLRWQMSKEAELNSTDLSHTDLIGWLDDLLDRLDPARRHAATMLDLITELEEAWSQDCYFDEGTLCFNPDGLEALVTIGQQFGLDTQIVEAYR